MDGNEASFQLLRSHAQLSKALVLAVADLDNPAPGLFLRGVPFDVCLLAVIDHMRNRAARFDGVQIVGASVASIGAQVLAAPMRRVLALDHDGAERVVESLAIIEE